MQAQIRRLLSHPTAGARRSLMEPRWSTAQIKKKIKKPQTGRCALWRDGRFPTVPSSSPLELERQD